MLDKTEWIQIARDIIETFGGRVVLTHLNGDEEYTLGAVVRPSQRLKDSTSVNTTELVCWVPGGLQSPIEEGDQLAFDDVTYVAEGVEPIKPDGRNVYAYAVFLRS